MAQTPLFTDSFDRYTDVREKWTLTQGAAPANDVAWARRSTGRGLKADGNGIRRLLETPTIHLLMEGGFRLMSRFQLGHPWLSTYFWDGVTFFPHADIRLTDSRHPRILTANAAYTPASGPETIIQFGVWYWVMLEILIDASGGFVRAALNHPNNVIVEETGIDTVNHHEDASPIVNVVGISNGFGDTFFCDDIVVQDGSGGATWYGDAAVIGKAVNGPGGSSDFSPVGDSPNHNCVDEASPDGDTTRVDGTTVGDRDLYTVAPITEVPSSTLVRFVGQSWRHKKSDSGPRTARSLMVTGASENVGPVRSIGTAYTTSAEAPQTEKPSGGEWGDVAALNALGLEIGYEVVS